MKTPKGVLARFAVPSMYLVGGSQSALAVSVLRYFHHSPPLLYLRHGGREPNKPS